MRFRYLGVMQGRLLAPEADSIQSFPRERWAEEFALATECDIDSIEWIYDVRGEDINPISSDSGVEEMMRLSEQHEIAIVSLCADYFMENPLLRASSEERQVRLRRLFWLISRCEQIGINRVVLPFVDNSAILTQAEKEDVI